MPNTTDFPRGATFADWYMRLLFNPIFRERFYPACDKRADWYPRRKVR